MNNNTEKIKKAILDKEVLFFVLPSPKLIEMIVVGSNDIVNSLPLELKKTILLKKGIAIENQLIEKYVNGSIDVKHKFIFDNCEIRVHQKTIII
jgi:hypothetical protein